MFVATFLGAPPMNVVPATVTSDEAGVRADGDGVAARVAGPHTEHECCSAASARAPGAPPTTRPCGSTPWSKAVENHLGSESGAVRSAARRSRCADPGRCDSPR
ncbi:hypothetical protein HBB16_04565 [Pseudonocardia sp. MCCB 268]|nr:hypothetical protein [Pseudonocardia cytotoxica]